MLTQIWCKTPVINPNSLSQKGPQLQLRALFYFFYIATQGASVAKSRILHKYIAANALY
jgi:hypothetical protein